MQWFFLISGWSVMAVVGYFIGALRGREWQGALLGALLGPVGWIFTLLMPDVATRCSMCGGRISLEFACCRHCGAFQRATIQFDRKPVDPLEEWEAKRKVETGKGLAPLVVRKKAPDAE